ncbi:MAG: ABC transporter permease subunit [Nitriliruptorales bacterium]|nr:ABC transporter permease subunit [Nitriliruptorales bacterium]
MTGKEATKPMTQMPEAPTPQPNPRPVTPGEPARSTRRWRGPAKSVATSNTVIALASAALLLSVWEYFGRDVNPIFASHPTAIVGAFGRLFEDGTLPGAFFDSMRPMAVGYGIAAAVGIPLGLLIGRYRTAEAALGFYVTGGYATPMVAFIPLLMLWFGLGFAVKVAVVVLMTLFPIVINTWAGVQAVPKTLIEVGQTFVAPQSAIMRKIILPATVPYIMTGLRLGVGRAVIGIVIAEFFSAIGGLGGVIIRSGQRFDTASLFVPIVILMVLGIGLTKAVGYLESRVAPWQRETSG